MKKTPKKSETQSAPSSDSEGQSTTTSAAVTQPSHGKLSIGTAAVYVDEHAYSLSEVNLPGPRGRGRHRWQIILVNRGDRLTEFRRDLGDVALYSAMQFRIPSLWVHTVGELLDMAEHLRYRTEDGPEQFVPTPTDLWARYFDKQEQRKVARRGRLTFGGTSG